MDDSKTSAPGSEAPQLRNACLSFWSLKGGVGAARSRERRAIFLQYKLQLIVFGERPRLDPSCAQIGRESARETV